MEVLKRRGAVSEGRTAVVGTQGEQELGWVEARDPCKKREKSFAETKEVAVQRR